MRRQRLIWFALGALTSGAFSVAATLLVSEESPSDQTVSTLVLREPGGWSWENDETHTSIAYAEETAPQGAPVAGEIASECGVQFFWIENPAAEDADYTNVEIPLVGQNFGALECIFARTEESEVESWFSTRSVPQNSEEISFFYGEDR